MPVQLTQRTRLEGHDRGSNGGRDREVLGVHNGDASSAAGDRNARGCLRVVEDVGAGAGEATVWSTVWGCGCRGVEDVDRKSVV